MQSDSQFIKRAVFFIAGFFLVYVAIQLGGEEMFFMSVAMLITPVVALAIGKFLARGTAVKRVVPVTCVEGDEISITIDITNTAFLPKFSLTIADTLPQWLQPAGDRSRNLILQLDPGEHRSVVYTVEAVKRGVLSIGPTKIAAVDPFGLFNFAQTAAGADTEMVVYPRPLPLYSSIIRPGAYGWRGSEDGWGRGSGSDFQGVREYRYGDDLRRVHWRTTARTGKLAVAEYPQGDSIDVILALDLCAMEYRNSGEGLESALEYAIKIAATLCDDLTRGGHAVQLLTTSHPQTEPLPSNAGKWTAPLMDVLARAEATSSTTLPEALEARRSGIKRGSTLIYLASNIESRELAVVLAAYEASGVSTAGFAIDVASFHPMRARRSAAKQPSPFAPLADDESSAARVRSTQESAQEGMDGPVRVIRKGDDLVEALYDLFGRNRSAGAHHSARAVAAGRGGNS